MSARNWLVFMRSARGCPQLLWTSRTPLTLARSSARCFAQPGLTAVERDDPGLDVYGDIAGIK